MRKLNRVTDQVNQDLLCADFVNQNPKIGKVIIEVDLNSLSFDLQPEDVDHWGHNFLNQLVWCEVDDKFIVAQQTLIHVCLHLVQQEANRIENYTQLKGGLSFLIFG